MHPISSMARILILLLLILRFLAAPIAARPDSYRPHTKAGFIVRVCAWPAQRPHRSTACPISLPSYGGLGHDGHTHGFWGTTARTRTSLILACLFHQVTWSWHHQSERRLVDSPRC
jgi:hypothetical protein